MDFALEETHREVEKLAGEILGELAHEDRLREIAKTPDRFGHTLFRALGQAGLLGLPLPESEGGAGMSLLEWASVAEAVGRRAAPLPFVAMSVAALALAEGGSAAQRAHWLPAFFEGRSPLTIALQGLAQADPSVPAATAYAEGGAWRVTGAWTSVHAAHVAHAIVVAARDEQGATQLFVVDPNGLGVSRETQVGTNDELLTALTLESAPLPESARLPCGGSALLARLLDVARLGNAATMLGCASEALRLTAAYASTRHQFDVPIGSFQAVQQRAGDAYIDVASMRSSLWQAAWRMATGRPAARELGIAAFFAADAGHRVLSAAQHIHGGMGFDRDYPLHRSYLLFKQTEFSLGGASAQLAMLGDLVARP
jgi:alkylation response protein AidB-like acyl-CoA dehydrogenase